jgi:5-methylcytosine-specific restriction protein A
MPTAPMRPCPAPGCPILTPGGYCQVHARPRYRTPLQERERPNQASRRWYRIARWRRLRQQVLVEQAYQCANPACRQVVLEQDIDHVIPHQGDVKLFWDRANLQALCRPCHTRKTLRGE